MKFVVLLVLQKENSALNENDSVIGFGAEKMTDRSEQMQDVGSRKTLEQFHQLVL